MNSLKHNQAVDELNSSDPAVRVKALRFIKNNIIGNRTKKDLYIQLNVIPKLVKFLKSKDTADSQVQIQAAIVLGSFAYGGEENVTEIAKHGAIKPLLECISLQNDPRLIEAAARALKAIYKCPTADKNDIFADHHLRDLIALLNPDSLHPKTERERIASVHTAELAATIIARCCDTNEQQIQIANAGAFPALVNLLTCGFSKAQEAALDALAYLCRENPEFGKAIVETKSETSDSPVKIMLNLIQDKSSTMRLIAAKCLTHLSRANAIGEYSNDITLIVLPTLVKLLDEKGPVREEAPHVLAYLIRDNEELQKAACDSDAVPKLADFVTHVVDQESSYYDPVGDGDKLKENALMALAAISSLTDDGRKLVVEAKIIPHIVAAMSHRSYGIRAAACQCTRSLSRSINILRTSLVDAGVATPLFKLLSDDSTDVQATACATLCNLVLDFSPMKKTIMELGGIEKLVELVRSPDNTLRLNAIWALKNLVYQAESDVKETVMKVLTYQTMETLISDQESVEVQEQALNLLRNLACTKPIDIEEVFKGLSENKLMSIIENKLCWWNENEEIIKQVLYVINNIASGYERHKTAIMNRPTTILTRILKYMGHDNPEIRVIAVWVLINLLWTEDKSASSQVRVQKLRDLGFEDKVKSMTNDENLDVRERVKTVLNQFSQLKTTAFFLNILEV
ncbi:armadillo repeat-containing protein 8-like isoform X1 [Rhizophagus clarus]|uniref:Armadillo repeat-containing protein 8-like isoform X1 n=1 Tax=Rhizophagus clarus TaxID=94130 RepID=A0A8H3R2V9_9GLOM|nr:armadillo repeat-containing protein 8-like isoform X1 [Rhizophagus clarus]